MDIHKSIMQIQGDIPRQPMRYASNDTSRDDKLTRTHQAARARYTANDTSGTTGESRNEKTDAGTLPPSPP